MIRCIIFKFRKWHACNYEWYRLYRSYENCRRPCVAILDMQMSKVPIISGYEHMIWYPRYNAAMGTKRNQCPKQFIFLYLKSDLFIEFLRKNPVCFQHFCSPYRFRLFFLFLFHEDVFLHFSIRVPKTIKLVFVASPLSTQH